VSGAGRYDDDEGAEVVGSRRVTVQSEGMGEIAGPPARGARWDVGSAVASEQNAAAAVAKRDVRMALDEERWSDLGKNPEWRGKFARNGCKK
jgi:hypothetical protein